MKAAVLRSFQEPPRYETHVDPEPLPGEALVRVRAAGLHPLVRLLASGKHYGSRGELPTIVGVDGVGELVDGTRVYFGTIRAPFGTMAELAPAARSFCLPVPPGLDDATVAAVANPGMSAWLALTWRARLEPGETVLILGATGVAGQLAIQLAKRLGAARVLAAGRRTEAFPHLRELGADVTLDLRRPRDELSTAIREAAGEQGIHVIVDYVWGAPAEAAIAAVTRRGLTQSARPVRFVQVGESAGANITLPAAVLRSSALELTGSGAGTVPFERIFAGVPELIARVAEGGVRIEVERIPLSEVATAWSRASDGKRVVFVP